MKVFKLHRRLISLTFTLTLLTITVHGQCPVSSNSRAYCDCTYTNNNGYRTARSIVCTGLDVNTTLTFTDSRDTFIEVIVKDSQLPTLQPNMFARVKARNYIMSNNGIVNIDDYTFLGAEDYMESLDLSDNEIASLPPGIFNYLRHVRVLNVANNKLYTAYKGMFKGLQSATYLNLGRNSISDIRSEAFSEMPRLRTLLLDGNSINDISDDSFTGLNRLQELILSSNRIASISENAFSELTDLRTLYLSLNTITSLPEILLKTNEYLEKLSLSQNDVTSIPENLFFRNKNLKSIDMSYNELTNVDKFPFKKLERLEELDLKYNKIKSIYKNVFEDLQSVKSLNLAHNEIEFLEENGLVGLAVAKTVKLDNNMIKIVPYGIFDAIGNVVSLNLSMNLIENFEDSVPFLANGVLEELDLSWNKIKEIPSSLFQKTRALKKLTMAHNEISLLYADSFTNVLNLEDLDLSYNRIHMPPGNIFINCAKLKTLRVSWNPLKHVSRSFLVGLDSLEEVMMEHGCLQDLPDGLFNPVADIVNATTEPLEESASPLTNLKVAHLGSNFLQSLSDASFASASSLTTLNVQENNITSIDPATFDKFPNIKHVNLSRNALGSSVQDFVGKARYIQTLDLSYNKVITLERRRLEHGSRIRELYLEGNPINCNCSISFLRSYDNLKDFDALQCGPLSRQEGELAVCFSIFPLGCSSYPNRYQNQCNNIRQTDLSRLSERIRNSNQRYEMGAPTYENYCIVEVETTTIGNFYFDPTTGKNMSIELPEITKISPFPETNYIRVEWKHDTDTSLVSGYRLRYTNSSNNVTYTSELVDDRLWYVITNANVQENYVICIDMVLLDGVVRSDERRCREVQDLVVKKVSKESKSGLLQLILPIIVVASVLIIIVLIIIGVRVSLRRKRHRDKQQQAMTASQKLGMWDFPFQPNIAEELVEQTILPFDIYSDVIVDPKFHLKKLKATLKGRDKTRRVKRRKSNRRQIPSVSDSVKTNSLKSDSMNSIRSTNSLDDLNTELFVSSHDQILPPPYTASVKSSSSNRTMRANGSVNSGFDSDALSQGAVTIASNKS